MKSDLQFGSKDMFTECLEIWKDWIHLEMNIDDVALQRKRLMLFGLNLTDNESPDEGQDHVSFITAVTSLANTTIRQLLTPMDEQRLRSTCLQKSGFFFSRGLLVFPNRVYIAGLHGFKSKSDSHSPV